MNYKVPLQVCEIQVSYRPKNAHRPQVQSSDDSHKILQACYDSDTIAYVESFIVLYLNRASRVIGYKVLGTGGTSGCIVDTKVLLGIALKCNASSIIISHNHPSNNSNPSRADRELTKKIKGACELMDLFLLDHLILTPCGIYHSFADEGEL